MDFLDDPEEMTPEQRLAEVAAILAAGLLRLGLCNREPASPTLRSSLCTEKRLDVSGAPRPVLREKAVTPY